MVLGARPVYRKTAVEVNEAGKLRVNLQMVSVKRA
jgi:hypothetical protein